MIWLLAFLGLNLEAGRMPLRLSATDVFADVRTLQIQEGFIPYDLIVPFWSDGAFKQRWMRLPPATKIKFHPTGDWEFPAGATFVKHFEVALDEERPQHKRRLETRILVNSATGVFGASYRWRPDDSDAVLVTEPQTETLLIQSATGIRTQTWSYPGPNDCERCHNPAFGGVLGPKTRQLNCELHYDDGVSENQLRHWARLGLFDRLITNDVASLPKLSPLEGNSGSLELRARSYLDANCSHCHRPGGAVAYFDARFETPLARQNLIDGPVVIDNGIDKARAIAPHDPWRSLILTRLQATDATRMPPLAHELPDEQGIALLKSWIESLPGPEVLPPPSFAAAPDFSAGEIVVKIIHPDPLATIRYTLDGSAPVKDSDIYQGPIHLKDPATLRARAYRDGFTRSIITQQTFVPGTEK
jgi:uncharacterized repeat protein (TIGR03806 family)